METYLSLEYDSIGDILYLNKRKRYPEQETEELDYGLIARFNPTTGAIENLEILFFSVRLSSGESLQLPIRADFQMLQPA